MRFREARSQAEGPPSIARRSGLARGTPLCCAPQGSSTHSLLFHAKYSCLLVCLLHGTGPSGAVFWVVSPAFPYAPGTGHMATEEASES